MKQLSRSLVLSVAVALSGCATLTASPEAQIKTGADSLALTTTTLTVVLRNQKITPEQGASYRVFLGAASTALDTAGAALVKCRGSTGSNESTVPDPCRPQVADLIALALDSVANVKRTLDSK